MSLHTLAATPSTVHWGHFDASLAPVLRVRSGDLVQVEAVSHHAMDNLRRVLAGIGLTLAQVLRVGAYLTHFKEDYETFNHLYRQYFEPARRPALEGRT